MWKKFNQFKGEKGFTLIETIVALAIMSFVGVTFLFGLMTSSKGLLIANEATIAESLVRSQMEYIKKANYAEEYTNILGLTQYSDEFPDTFYFGDLDGNPVESIIGIEFADGIQKITLIVYNGDKEVFTLAGYKVKIENE